MAWIAVAIAGSSLVSGLIGANAASDAAGTQAASAQAGIDENRRQFDALQKLLAPYVQSGAQALGAQGNLIGLNGQQAQQDAISQLQSGPQFQAMLQQGQNSILQNASATGGLRGGNTQAALAQFSPQLLSQLIQQQYSNLGSLTSIGQNAAAGTGNAGMQSANSIANLLQQQGAATAGGQLAQGQAFSSIPSSLLTSYFIKNAMGNGGNLPSTGAGVISGGDGLKL